MNTNLKTIFTLCLLTALPTTHASFARTAKNLFPIASAALATQQYNQHKSQQLTDLKKSSVFVSPDLQIPETTTTQTSIPLWATKAKMSITHLARSLFPVAQCEEQAATPIDFSKIKKYGEVNHSPYESGRYKDPKIAVYTLSSKKELWFFLDNHYDSRWITCVDTLIREENFTHGIIESTTDSPDSCTFTETVEDAKYYSTLSWWKKFKHNIYDPWFGKSTMGHALVLLQQQNKIIKPGEYDSFEQTYVEWEKRGLCLNDIQRMKNLKKNYSTANEQDKKIYNDLLGTMINIRDEKIAQTIFETMQDETATKVLIVYGAAHWCTLEKCLEHSFGKPTMITFKEYDQLKNITEKEQETEKTILRLISCFME